MVKEQAKKPVENRKLGYLGYLGFLAFLATPLKEPVFFAFLGFFLFFLAFKMSNPTKYALFCAIVAVISIVAHNLASSISGEFYFFSGLFFSLSFIFLFAIPIFLIWRISLCFKKTP